MPFPLLRREPRYREPTHAARHVHAAIELRRKYGPVYATVQETFYGLDMERLDRLLQQYGERYGSGAQSYARKTIPRWRSGEVRISGQTMGRLLELLPFFLSSAEKLALIRQLREQACNALPRERIQITVRDREGADRVFERGLELVRAAARVEIPPWFHEVRGWLEQADAQALQNLASEVEQQAHLARVAALMTHVGLLYQMQRELPFRAAITMSFEMPTAQVTIRLRARRGDAMEQDVEAQDMLVRMQQAAVEYRHLEGQIDFFDYVLRTLTPEEQERAREMAIREGLDLQAFVHKLRVQSEEARKSIQATMDAANEMKRQGHRGTISSEITSSAGATRIEIHTDRPPLVTAAIAAAVLLVLLAGLGLFLLAGGLPHR